MLKSIILQVAGIHCILQKNCKKGSLRSELKSIISLLNRDIIEINCEKVGFIFPIHGMTIPIPVKWFLKKLDLKSTKYIFAIATRAGTTHRAFNNIENILKKKGKNLDSYFTLNMPSNDPKFEDWHPVTDEEIVDIESEIRNKLDFIQNIILNIEKHQENDTDFIIPVNFILERLVLLGMLFAEYDGAKDYFYSDSKCIECGTCDKVCPSRKIKIIDKKPVWQDNIKCYMCYACLNYCPVQSVQIKSKWYMKSYTEDNARYSHPYGTADDISRQKI